VRGRFVDVITVSTERLEEVINWKKARLLFSRTGWEEMWDEEE
jgi:hypothetical protein